MRHPKYGNFGVGKINHLSNNCDILNNKASIASSTIFKYSYRIWNWSTFGMIIDSGWLLE